MTNIYLKNAAILTAASLVLRAAGMGLRVLLAAHLGSEGMGLYQLVFTAYGVCIAMAVGGLSVASTRLSAQALAQNDRRGVCRLMQRLIGMGAVLGCTAAAAQYLLANVLARWLLGDLRAAAALQILAFSLPFMAVGGGNSRILYGGPQCAPKCGGAVGRAGGAHCGDRVFASHSHGY